MTTADQREFPQIIDDNAKRVAVLTSQRVRNKAEDNELNIRSAIVRFADGRTKTDGSWTVQNLVVECGVPRPTLYRQYKAPLSDFQSAAAVAPLGSGGFREELRRLRSELRAERRERIEQRRHFEQVQSVLVQRLYALSLAYAQAVGDDKVIDLLSHQRNKSDAKA